MPNGHPFTIHYTFDLGDLGYHTTDIDLDPDVILDGADHFEMIVFENEDDLKEKIMDYVDEVEFFRERIEEAMRSPYYKMKFLDMLKEVGLI